MATRRTAKPASESAAAQRAGRALILATFLNSVGFTFIFPLLPLYVRELIGPGADAALWAGFAMAATPAAGAVCSPLWGLLADRVGYRPMLLRALGSTTVIIGLMALPNQVWQLVLLRGLVGALGSFQAAAMAALASWSKPEDLSHAISRLQMSAVFGAIVGPMFGGVIAAFFGVRASALAGGIVVGAGTLLVARWFHEPAGRRAAARARGRGGPFRPQLLWLPMLTLVAVQFTDASFNPILPLLLAQGGHDPAASAGLAGLAASGSAAAAAGASALAGRGLRRGVGRRTIAGAAAALALLSLGAMAAPLPYELIAVRVLCGGGAAGLAIAAYSAGGLMAPPGRHGSAYGLLSSAAMVGYAASPIVAGSLAALDLRAVLVLDGVLCLAASAGWMLSGGTALSSPLARPLAGHPRPTAR